MCPVAPRRHRDLGQDPAALTCCALKNVRVRAEAIVGHRMVNQGEAGKARRDAVAVAEAIGWTVARETKRGYLIMRCSCGRHQETLHKTPSNPAHYAQKVQRMTKTCRGGLR